MRDVLLPNDFRGCDSFLELKPMSIKVKLNCMYLLEAGGSAMPARWIEKLLFIMVCCATFDTAPAQQRQLSVYGYIDLEYEYNTAQKVSTFDIHHFNVISNWSFKQFRVFSEIEWEHGPSLDAGGGQGEIVLERAWFEYRHSDELKIRCGKFLSPFGIYNLLHDATPTFLTTGLPLMYQKHRPFGVKNDRLYGKFYAGLQALGEMTMESGMRFEYTLGLGNGRGENSFSEDNDNSKAVMVRALVQPSESIHIGASFYGDRNEHGLSGRPRAREQAYGVDVEFDNDRFQIQFEYARFRMEKNDLESDFQNAHAYYGQVAYTIAGRLTPVLRYDGFDPNINSTNDARSTWLLGLNFSPDPDVDLKAEVQFRAFENSSIPSNRLFLSSIAVAF
jgi:opacity protein-like surface antigen